MKFDITAITPEQKKTIEQAKAAMGVKFLPAQQIRRIVDPKGAAGLKTLGAQRREKAKRVAERAAKAGAVKK